VNVQFFTGRKISYYNLVFKMNPVNEETPHDGFDARTDPAWTCGVAAYLDDLSIVAPPAIAAVGLRVFREQVARRGWRVNLDKTVCGVGYYTAADAERCAQLQAAHDGFDGLLRPDMVQARRQPRSFVAAGKRPTWMACEPC
jgi:hypothetical protein